MIESAILVVCDEPTTSRIWAFLVTDIRCKPIVTYSLEQAITILEETSPDLIVIDVTSRKVSGVEICKALRDHTVNPILLLTPINNESHTLEAYQAGVSECVIKPISPALFLAKIRVWLSRTWTVQVESLDKLTIGNLILEPSRHLLESKDGKGLKIHLSNLEFRVLYLLMSHPNQPFSHTELVERIWGIYGEGNSTLVKNVVYRLRKKIEPNPNEIRYIRTVTGGYLFKR